MFPDFSCHNFIHLFYEITLSIWLEYEICKFQKLQSTNKSSAINEPLCSPGKIKFL